nr:unnamed protein product [Callosobruchus analis]
MVLNTDHDYYHQIQGNLWLTNRNICYLVIWTPNESLISVDNDWATNKVNTLKTIIWMYIFHFYMSVILPWHFSRTTYKIVCQCIAVTIERPIDIYVVPIACIFQPNNR